tara:strand:- start:53 stop:187 length:135 start_codon:yes stop_codon:yes gene_type:complete
MESVKDVYDLFDKEGNNDGEIGKHELWRLRNHVNTYQQMRRNER